jgi:hypothetical protein
MGCILSVFRECFRQYEYSDILLEILMNSLIFIGSIDIPARMEYCYSHALCLDEQCQITEYPEFRLYLESLTMESRDYHEYVFHGKKIPIEWSRSLYRYFDELTGYNERLQELRQEIREMRRFSQIPDQFYSPI